MAQIIVDGGSWWSPTNVLLRSGIHLSDDPELIAAAESAGLEFITVVRDESYVAQPASPQQGARLVEEIKPHDESGPLTSRDLKEPELTCSICVQTGDRTKPFANRAALHAHRRAKHPTLDPATGEIREGVHAPTVPSVQTTYDETAASQGMNDLQRRLAEEVPGQSQPGENPDPSGVTPAQT